MRLRQVDFAVLILIVCAFAISSIQGHGRRDDEQREFLVRAAPAIELIPDYLGNWRMVNDDPLDDRVLAILQCERHVNRTYVHAESGESVTLTVLLGPAGPMVAHSPEVCLPSAQYEMLASSEPVELSLADGKRIAVKRATFRSTALSRQVVRLYYAWIRADGGWVAPMNPRWELGGEIGLWKLQFATVLTGPQAGLAEQAGAFAAEEELEDLPTQDAIERFLTENGAVLRDVLTNSPSEQP